MAARKKRVASDTVKNLEVEKDAFDRVLKKLIATPPIRRATPRSKRKSSR